MMPMNEVTPTYLKLRKQRLRSFKYPFNNGRIERISHKINILMNVDYGYRNFMNLKNRIILHFNQKIIKPATQHQQLTALAKKKRPCRLLFNLPTI